MYQDDIREQEYRAFVKELNREPPPDDECGTLAAYDAVTRAYGLDSYTASHKGKGRTKAATAAQPGGVFLSHEGGVPPCRA